MNDEMLVQKIIDLMQFESVLNEHKKVMGWV